VIGAAGQSQKTAALRFDCQKSPGTTEQTRFYRDFHAYSTLNPLLKYTSFGMQWFSVGMLQPGRITPAGLFFCHTYAPYAIIFTRLAYFSCYLRNVRINISSPAHD
jgi:hypothetical protein